MKEIERGGKRERDRETERKRNRDRETERDRERETERESDRERQGQGPAQIGGPSGNPATTLSTAATAAPQE